MGGEVGGMKSQGGEGEWNDSRGGRQWHIMKRNKCGMVFQFCIDVSFFV